MCGGVFYTLGGQEYRVYFPNPKATLPVKMKTGAIEQLPWGRRKQQHGELPMGGWARLDSIYAGRWDRWQPQPVKLLISSFMEKDIERNSHWYDISAGKFIQGLVARFSHEQRVYVVTVEPEMAEAVHDRWPRILSG